jgi:hypothetical protein
MATAVSSSTGIKRLDDKRAEIELQVKSAIDHATHGWNRLDEKSSEYESIGIIVSISEESIDSGKWWVDVTKAVERLARRRRTGRSGLVTAQFMYASEESADRLRNSEVGRRTIHRISKNIAKARLGIQTHGVGEHGHGDESEATRGPQDESIESAERSVLADFATPFGASKLLGVSHTSISRAIADGRLSEYFLANGALVVKLSECRRVWTSAPMGRGRPRHDL